MWTWEWWWCLRSGRDFRVGDILKCGWGFTLKVNFPGGKNLCAQEWGGEGEIIVHNAAMNQNPKPKLVLLLPCCCSITYFTSTSNINYFLLFFMLEHFFRPFLKTRSYDRSAHTFGSSHRFLEVPHKRVLNKWFVGIFYTYLRSPYCYLVGGGGIRRARRALQVAEGHQPSAGARSRRP